MHAHLLLHGTRLLIASCQHALLPPQILAIGLCRSETQLVVIGVIPSVPLAGEDAVPGVADGSYLAAALVKGIEVPRHVSLGEVAPVVAEVELRGRLAVSLEERRLLLFAQRGCPLGHEAVVVSLYLVIEVFLDPVAVHGTRDNLRVLCGMCDVPGSLDGHLLPVEASPALCHHQQVEGAAVLLIVLLEEVVGLRHEAFDFAGEQHLCHDISTVEGIVSVNGIAHGERHGLVRHQMDRGDVDVNRLEGRILILEARVLQRGLCEFRTCDEEEAVGIDMSDAVEHGDLIYSYG